MDLLAIVIDSEILKASETKSNKYSFPNAESIYLIKFTEDKPVELIQIPIEIAIKFSENKKIYSLAEIPKEGGVELVSSVISEIFQLPDER